VYELALRAAAEAAIVAEAEMWALVKAPFDSWDVEVVWQLCMCEYTHWSTSMMWM